MDQRDDDKREELKLHGFHGTEGAPRETGAGSQVW